MIADKVIASDISRITNHNIYLVFWFETQKPPEPHQFLYVNLYLNFHGRLINLVVRKDLSQ